MRKAPVLGWLMAGALMVGAGAAAADGDPEEGKRVFNKCRACHVVDQEQNRVGPHLVGLFGREAGSVEDYNYSDAMASADVTWNEETLAEYLAAPRDYVPGTKMVFVGLRDEEEIEDIIAYLKEATATN